MTSSIFIRNIRLYAYHGVLPQERRVGGWYLLNARVHYSIYKATESDNVADTLNYAELCQLLRNEMAIPSQLLEHVAGRMARAVLSCYTEAEAVDIELTKENPPMGINCDGAGVTLHLDRK